MATEEGNGEALRTDHDRELGRVCLCVWCVRSVNVGRRTGWREIVGAMWRRVVGAAPPAGDSR